MTDNSQHDYYSEAGWRTLPHHAYVQRELWYPLSHSVAGWECEFHDLMLHDHLRMRSYKAAISRVVEWSLRERLGSEEPLRVLDLGTGYGILAAWVAEAHREASTKLATNSEAAPPVRVYAIDANHLTASEAYRRLYQRGDAHHSGRTPGPVLVLRASGYELSNVLRTNHELIGQFDPHLASEDGPAYEAPAFDVIISETLGALPDSEDGIDLLAHACTRHLREGGRVVPTAVESFVVPIRAEEAHGVHADVRSGNVRYLCDAYRTGGPPDGFDFTYDVILPVEDELSERSSVHPINVWSFGPGAATSSHVPSWQRTTRFVVRSSGLFSGFKAFFRATLAASEHESIILDIGGDNIGANETADCWKHLLLPVEHQQPVVPGDVIDLVMRRSITTEDRMTRITYGWRGEVQSQATGSTAFDQQYQTRAPFHPGEPALHRVIELTARDYESSTETLLLGGSDQVSLEALCEVASALEPEVGRIPTGSIVVGWPSTEQAGFRWWPWGSPTWARSLANAPMNGMQLCYVVDYKNVKNGEPAVSVERRWFADENECRELAEAASQRLKALERQGFVSVFLLPAVLWQRMDGTDRDSLDSLVYLIEMVILFHLREQDARLSGEALSHHWLPAAFSTSIEGLLDHERTCDSNFRVPATLFVAAVHSALRATQLSPDKFHRCVPRLPSVRTLLAKGLARPLIHELAGDRDSIVQRLARHRLRRDVPSVKPQRLEQIDIQGEMSASELGLGVTSDDPQAHLFITVLIVLLKEAVEHRARFVDRLQDDEAATDVRVICDAAARVITVTNPTLRETPAPRRSGHGNADAQLFNRHLRDWRIGEPRIDDGTWLRELRWRD